MRWGMCVIAAIAAALVTAPGAQASEDTYLDALSARGFQVMWQSRPFLLAAGHAMCDELQAGATPEAVAAHWVYPNATPQNLLDMATAARAELCPA